MEMIHLNFAATGFHIGMMFTGVITRVWVPVVINLFFLALNIGCIIYHFNS